jgi:hypothetical protein
MRESGWLFEFNSTAYLRTRSYLDLLGGNYPLLVRSDGTVTVVMEASVAGKAVPGGVRRAVYMTGVGSASRPTRVFEGRTYARACPSIAE